MKRIHIVLIIIIVIQLAAAGWVWNVRQPLPPLPQVSMENVFSTDIVEQITKKALRTDRSKANDWIDLAEDYRALGLFPAADYCFSQADRLSPTDRTFVFYWAVCLSRMGRIEEARPKFEEVAGSNEDLKPYCHLRMAQDYLRENRAELAIPFLKKAGNIPWAKLHLARIYIRTERARQAIPLLDEILNEHSDAMRAVQMTGWM